MSDTTRTAWVAVRLCRDDGREWMDLSTLGVSTEVAARKARGDDRLIADWATCNPVKRIACVEIREVTPPKI